MKKHFTYKPGKIRPKKTKGTKYQLDKPMMLKNAMVCWDWEKTEAEQREFKIGLKNPKRKVKK
jgi:hypothetical protein